jgi:hypothetical protein
MISCSLCGYVPNPDARRSHYLVDGVPTDPEHDCVGRRIEAALAKERSRIACVIRRVARRWGGHHGEHSLGLALVELASAIEQETA